MTEVLAPSGGTVRPLSEAPDPVFAAEMVGSGVAVDPGTTTGTVEALAPVAGRLVKAHPHAFVILTGEGVGILVHLGIDTVKLGGEGFELLAAEQAEVGAGQPVTRWDPAAVAAAGLSPMVMVCVMDTAAGAVTSARLGQPVSAGDPLFSWP